MVPDENLHEIIQYILATTYKCQQKDRAQMHVTISAVNIVPDSTMDPAVLCGFNAKRSFPRQGFDLLSPVTQLSLRPETYWNWESQSSRN